MARGVETKTKNKAILMDTIFVARRVIDMAREDVSYPYRQTVAPHSKRESGKPGKVYVEGVAYGFNEFDIRTPAKEGGALEKRMGYKDFIRLICVNEVQKKNKQWKEYAVDASHLELGPHSVIDDRFSVRDWKEDEDSKPQPVVDFVGNSLDLPDFEARLLEKFGVVLQHPNELTLIRDEQKAA